MVLLYPISIQLCENLKNGTTELIYDVYFSDMLRNSMEFINKLKENDEFRFINNDNIKNKILEGWSSGNYQFDPESNNGDIFTYFGKVRFISRGEQKEFEISLKH